MCLECSRYEQGDAFGILDAAVLGIHLASDVWMPCRVFAYFGDMTGIQETSRDVPIGWGHHGGALTTDAIEFAAAHGPRLCELGLAESFNRLSNSLRLYHAALSLVPSDVAMVVFVSALEGLFTTTHGGTSHGLALGVSHFLETEPDARAALYERTKRIYALRSK